MQSSQALQSVAGGPVAGPSTSFLAPTMPQAQSITTNNGDVNFAGRDVNVQHHYHSYPDKVDITAILGAIRNLRIIHSDNLSKATPGTGVWFFKTKMFLIWLDPNGDLKVLWGTGIPGAGKTVLTSIVIRELEARAAVEGSRICVCYVYCRYSDRADLTVRNILEILVKQTVERHAECESIAEQAFARHVREKTQPTETELLELLHRFSEATSATFYFLDALDEAPDRIQVDLVQKLASLNVRLFITSRPLESVQARLPNARCFPIAAQEGDLDLHIAQEIARSRDLAALLDKEGSESSLRDEIVSLIKSKCGGMFLHASLQLDALCDCINARDVRQTLEAFPARIEDVYLQTWDRILKQKPNQASTAKALLVWVLNAAIPMKIEALERAVAISPDTYKFEPDRLVPRTTLVALCRGLVTLEEKSRIIRLVHYTAKDTLQGLLSDSFPLPHPHLVTVCMSYLTEHGFQNTAIHSEEEFNAALDADPLLAYASDYWATHAQQCLDDEETKQRITTFVRSSNAFPAFIDPVDQSPRYFDILSPIHILVVCDLPISLIIPDELGDPNVLTKMEQESPLTLAIRYDPNEAAVKFLLAHPEIQVNLPVRSYKWSPLMGAVDVGSEEITKLLLARPDIQVNLVDDGGCSALAYAIKSCGEEDIGVLDLLLAHPKIQVNSVTESGQSALMHAASLGCEGYVGLLLAHPKILVNLVDNNGCSALLAATKGAWEGWKDRFAEDGREEVAKLLLARSEILVNQADNCGRSALLVAGRNGCEGIAKLLLAHPEVQVNLLDNRGWSALMEATFNGHEGIVKLLLAHPEIQANLANKGGSSALILATRYGREGIVKLLLAHPDTMVNLVDNDGRSTLQVAIEGGKVAIIELLLAHPEILVNLKDDDGQSALIKAALLNQEDVVNILLVHPEIEVDLVDNKGWSALMKATYKGCQRIVRRLLEHPKIQVNLVDDQGWSALMMAARDGWENLVKLLLAHPGIQVNLVNQEGWSALTLGVRHGREGIVKLLLARIDIQVNLVDGQGWPALLLASMYGHEEIVRLLLAHIDVQVNSVTSTGWSALMLASREGHEGIATLLLARPEILINSVDNEGWSAVMKAARRGHNGVAQLLLSRNEIQINLVADNGWSALMMAAFYGHEGIAKLLLAHPNTLVDSDDNEGWPSARLASTQGGGEAKRLAGPHIDTKIESPDGHTAMSLALVNGHMGIVQLLQEFELLRAGPCTSDGLTLGDGVRQGPSALDKPADEEVCSRWDSEDYQGTEEWLVGDAMKDMGIGCANDEGADVNRTHGELSGSRRDAKRLRVDEDDDSQGAVHDMVDPASKRRRGAAAVAGDP